MNEVFPRTIAWALWRAEVLRRLDGQHAILTPEELVRMFQLDGRGYVLDFYNKAEEDASARQPGMVRPEISLVLSEARFTTAEGVFVVRGDELSVVSIDPLFKNQRRVAVGVLAGLLPYHWSDSCPGPLEWMTEILTNLLSEEEAVELLAPYSPGYQESAPQVTSDPEPMHPRRHRGRHRYTLMKRMHGRRP